MNYKEYTFIKSDIKELEELIATTPEDDVISLLGFQHRLKSQKDKLKNVVVKIHRDKKNI